MDQVRRRAAMDIHSAQSSSIGASITCASCIDALLLALLALCLNDRVERAWHTTAFEGSFHVTAPQHA